MDIQWEACYSDSFLCDCCDEHYYTQCIDGYIHRDKTTGKIKKILCKYCMDYIDSSPSRVPGRGCGHCSEIKKY